MGSLVLDVLRKGIWSSFCGGWYYDPTSATFANTFHLYLFLFFLCFPFSVYVYLPRNAINWTVYTAVVGVLFFIIKFINISLHRMFDSNECVVEEPIVSNATSDLEKKKSSQKSETREEEGIELQVLSSDKKRENQPNEDAVLLNDAEFNDFNSGGVKEDNVLTTSGTIDLKVDVHRKNSSDSDETSTKNNQLSIVDEVNIQKPLKEKAGELRATVTTSEEVLIEKGKRNLSLKENTSQDVSVAVDSVDDGGGRLSERSRQYSVSVTLGEDSADKNTIGDPTPARSMELNNQYEADANKSLLFWKEKWDRANPRSYRPRMNGICGADIRHPNACLRSTSPLSMYTSDIVYPIAEHKDEQQYSGLIRSIQSDDDDDDDDDYLRRPDNEEDDYGDIEDLDVEVDSSRSPLLTKKRLNSQSSGSCSGCNPPCNRKRGYVDSLTRKYKQSAKSSKYTGEKKDRSRMENIEQTEGVAIEIRGGSSNEIEAERPPEDEDQIAVIFDWLFALSGGERNLLKEAEITEELRKGKNDINIVMKQLDELKSQYPEILEGRSRFPSAPTLITGSRERSSSHRRPRSETCSQLEIGTVPSTERKTSVPEGTVSQSTSVDVYSSTDYSKMEHSGPKQTESNEASSSGSNTELSSLLPPPYNTPVNSPTSIPFYHGHRTPLRYDTSFRTRARRHARSTQPDSSYFSMRDTVPSTSVFRVGDIPSELNNFVRDMRRRDSNNTHIATSYDDTTEGAVHIFQDENGKWMSYTFDEQGSGIAVNLAPSVARRKESGLNPIEEQKTAACSDMRVDNCTTFVNSNLRQPAHEGTAALASTSNALVTNTGSDLVPSTELFQLREMENGLSRLETVDYLGPLPPVLNIAHNQAFMSNSVYSTLRFSPVTRLHVNGPATSQSELNFEFGGIPRSRFDFDHIEVLEDEKRKRRYYKFPLFPFSGVKIYFDRLSLDALLDFNETYFETFLCIGLAIVVSLLGAVILHLHYYHDIAAFIFCFVIATSHYSLLKSVQPDAASPVHGFNKIVVYSRPVYFILCSSLIVGLHYLLQTDVSWLAFRIYNIDCDPYDVLKAIHDFLQTFVLFLPLFFTMGMFPQVNTFLMYVFEQIDMHVFGGSAVTSLKSAAYCIFRSVLAVLLLFGFAYGGLNELKTSQHLLFSIYIALLVMFAYHLSRCTCDPAPIWNILVKQLWPIDEVPRQVELRNVKVDKKTTNKKPKKKTSVTYGKEIKMDAVDDKDAKIRASISSQSGRSAAVSEKKETVDDELENADDRLSAWLQKTVNSRLQSDLIISCAAGVLLFSIHRSTIFTALNLNKNLNQIMWCIAGTVGFLLHYIIPQLRKQLPWLCIARPVLRSVEHEQFEAQAPAIVTWFEKVYLYLGFIEKNIIYPIMFIGCITSEAPDLARKVGPLASSLILTVCSLKCLRLSFSHIPCQYLILAFSVLFFQLEYISEIFVVDYFIISILYYKIYDLLLKVQFVLTYIAPWQITWGSAFHAFAQPFSLPHSAMMFAQAALSALLSSPLYPFLGSAIFLTSYPRPVKFWERDYNTRRVDHSNTKMASHLEKNLGADDNNLNSIFYEHLTRSLQRSLCGDLIMGRWGEVSAGDCFILASDYLNCLIHIVELGNGLVTFQMRGLEFRGTYCQQREVEAITDGVEENDGCCCCKPGHLPYMLSLNAAFSQRWLAWEVTSGKYILEGYSISDNSAGSMLQVFDFRKMLISYYVKSIIYFAVIHPKLEDWISSTSIRDSLKAIIDKNFVDLDPVFNINIDEDYDFRYSGITRNSFCSVYVNWIRYCNSQRQKPVANVQRDSPLVTLCFALSLLGRRALGTASHSTAASVEFFLYGVHTLFKGDFRIASTRDEWVFADMELLRKVVAPAIRMSLKLHQDHFMAPDEYECHPALYAAISSHLENIVISHEGDPAWRKAVLSGKPSLLAFRRVMDEGSDDYKIIMLSKRYLSFRVIKMNRECVRGLWAGQQQELVFLRNLNPERGSIQNAKQALRNIINSSCDQPIGYPIFVSPLTTSYAETNTQYIRYVGGPVSIKSIKNFILNFCSRVRKRCVEGCSSGSSAHSQDEGGFGHEGVYSTTNFNMHSTSHQSMETSLTGSGGTITRVSAGSGVGGRSVPSPAGPSKPPLLKLVDLLSPPGGNPLQETMKGQDRKSVEKEEEEKEPILHRVKIIDPGQVHDGINQGRLIDVIWPDEVMRQRGGRNFWKDWVPETGMEGQVVHRWIPNHPNPNKRSTFDRTILLIKIDDKYVPISENGVQDLGAEV